MTTEDCWQTICSTLPVLFAVSRVVTSHWHCHHHLVSCVWSEDPQSGGAGCEGGEMCNYLLTKIIQIKLNPLQRPVVHCSPHNTTTSTSKYPVYPVSTTGPSGDKWLQCCGVIRETIFIRTLHPPTTWAVLLLLSSTYYILYTELNGTYLFHITEMKSQLSQWVKHQIVTALVSRRLLLLQFQVKVWTVALVIDKVFVFQNRG